MKAEINLIHALTEKNLSFLKLKSRINKITSLVLIFFILSSVGILFVFLMLRQKLSTNEKKISLLKEQIIRLEKNESYITTIYNRIEVIKSFLGTRNNYNMAISNFKLFLIPGFSPLSLEIGKNGDLKIDGECQNTDLLTKLYQVIDSIAQQSKYSRVYFPSIGRSSEGKYSLFLELKK